MMQELLETLVCPETHQKLALAESAVVTRLNESIRAGQLKNRAGKLVTERIDAGFVREDRTVLYAVRGGLPSMLIDESIPLLAL